MKLSLTRIIEALTDHAQDRIDERLHLTPLEAEKTKVMTDKALVNWNRDHLFKLPKQFWKEDFFPPTLWTKVHTPDNKKSGVAILSIGGTANQLQCVTVIGMNWVDPQTLTPLNKSKRPLDGMSLSQFEKYIKFLSSDPMKSKPTWREFKEGKRESSKVSWNTSRGSGRF